MKSSLLPFREEASSSLFAVLVLCTVSVDACTTPRTSSLSGLCAVDREEDGGAVEIKRRIGERRRRKKKERDRELGGRWGQVCADMQQGILYHYITTIILYA